jgi:flavin reductase (DIM6/NTAB) family NADH-FMN oxidoreductase RutF/DNA-binding GntR family transcriptional regulator
LKLIPDEGPREAADGLKYAQNRLDQKLFRDVIGHFASGVTVITTTEEGHDVGSTASAVTSLSMEPPMLLVCLNRSSTTGQTVDRVGKFAVNILDENQTDLAFHFASHARDKFSGVDVARGVEGLPLLDKSLAQLECVVVERATGGSHTIFLAEVISAKAGRGTPLTYYRGSFGKFVEAREDAIYQELRTAVLERRLPLDAPLSVEDLAGQLGAQGGSVAQALARLSQDGLVKRNGPSIFSIATVDEDLVLRSLRSRETLTIGVLTEAIKTVSPEELVALRRAAEEAVPQCGSVDGDPAARLSMRSFHERLIALSHNVLLTDLYRRLSVSTVLDRVLVGVTWGDTQHVLSECFKRLVESIEAHDLESAIREVHEYTDILIESCVSAVRNAGGKI